MSLRIRVEVDGRSSWHDVDASEVTVGSSPNCRLCIPHDSVAKTHARLVVRRDRVMVVDMGHAPRGTTVAGRRVHAPVVLPNEAELGLGEARLKVCLEVGRSSVPERLPGFGRLRAEMDPSAIGTRRFVLDGGLEAMLAVEAARTSWPEAVRPPEHAHVATVAGRCRAQGYRVLVEAVEGGVGLYELVRAEESGVLDVPQTVRGLILAQLQLAVGAWHAGHRAHGSLSLASVRLCRSGRVCLLSPGPEAHGSRHRDLDDLAELRKRLRLRSEARIRVDLAGAKETLRSVTAGHEDPSMSTLARLARLLQGWTPQSR